MNFFRKLFLIILIFLIQWGIVKSQPYFDVAGINGWHQPAVGQAMEWYGTAFITVPVNITKNNLIIPEIEFEQRKLFYASNSTVKMYGTDLPLTFLHSSADSIYSYTVTIIPRSNSTESIFDKDAFQLGGAFIETIRMSKKVKIKFGLYYNREFFSDFYVPLAGIEWKINDKTQLFGALPNSLRLEHQIKKYFFIGAAFNSITNSYRRGKKLGYYKVEDNHAVVYADINFKGNISLRTEAGYTLFREINDRSIDNHARLKEDGFIFKAGIFYRIRLPE